MFRFVNSILTFFKKTVTIKKNNIFERRIYMYTAADIASWFLLRNKCDYDTGVSDELISNLKLQKLLYYAQGCVLAITGKPLFDEDFQAWEHGPVVPEIYQMYKGFGRNGIEFNGDENAEKIDSEIKGILEDVYYEFGQYSAWKLRDMTHEELPWKETPKNGIISKESIKKYFEENYIEQ